MSTLYKCWIKWGTVVEHDIPARVGYRTLIGDSDGSQCTSWLLTLSQVETCRNERWFVSREDDLTCNNVQFVR